MNDTGRIGDVLEAYERLILDAIKALPPAAGTSEILVPGERGARTEAERGASGIPLGPKVWRELTEIATGLDVTVPAPAA